MIKKYWYVVVALFLMAVVTGCSKQQTAAGPSPSFGPSGSTAMSPDMKGAVVNVELSEWAITLKPSSVKAGMIHFMVKNIGTGSHTFAIQGQGVEEKLKNNLASGKSDMLMVTLKKGIYKVYCPTAGHEAKGMKAEFKVE